jgi:hypothetical protein
MIIITITHKTDRIKAVTSDSRWRGAIVGVSRIFIAFIQYLIE